MDHKTDKDISRLLGATEQAAQFSPASPTDFQRLSDAVAARSDGRERVSVSTLKRLWGYVRSSHRPSVTVLSILARFCGYRDWSHFVTSPHPDSGFLVSTPVVTSSVPIGCVVEIRWAPDRMARLRHCGDGRFEVVESLNSKIVAGDCLSAAMICRGYPFYATDIRRGPTVIPAYVAGREGGVLSVALLD